MKLNRRRLLVSGIAVFAQPALGRAAALVKVEISADQTAFNPSTIQVKVGDTVEWTNESILIHTVTCDPSKAKDKNDCALPEGAKPFDSGDMELGKTFAHVFTVPGTYRYFCIAHEDMNMVGTVVAAA